jgi:hypothetical protein
LNHDIRALDSETLKAAQISDTYIDSDANGGVILDFSTFINFDLTLTGTLTLGNPTTEKRGQSGFIIFRQDSDGNRPLVLQSNYKTPGGAGITLSTNPNATDIVPYIVAADGSILLTEPQLDFS